MRAKIIKKMENENSRVFYYICYTLRNANGNAKLMRVKIIKKTKKRKFPNFLLYLLYFAGRKK